MIKRTPQEIADFFGCYVAQDMSDRWYAYEEKPHMERNNTWDIDCGRSVSIIGDDLFDIPADHDWTHLYEPQITCEKRIKNARATHEERMEAPYPDNKSEACYADQYDSDNKPGARKEYAIESLVRRNAYMYMGFPDSAGL